MRETIPHGGDLDAAARLYGRPLADWLDLSTGINPHPYELAPIAPDTLRRLPLASEVEALESAARQAYRVPEGMEAVAAPGTQALIQWLPRLVPAGRVAVLAPTYGEHAVQWRAGGADVRAVRGLDAALGGGAKVVVVTNPNNPDGRRHDPAALLEAAAALGARGGLLVVDEAFADVAPQVSLVPQLAPETAAIVLRSFGKFFGLPGLRLGFAVAAPPLAATIRAALGSWAVSGPALAIGRAALADDAWQAEMRYRLRNEAAALDRVLTAAGLAPAGGTDLFRLVEVDDALALHEHLARAGIWVRRFEGEPRRLRFGLPGNGANLQRLAEALEARPERGDA